MKRIADHLFFLGAGFVIILQFLQFIYGDTGRLKQQQNLAQLKLVEQNYNDMLAYQDELRNILNKVGSDPDYLITQARSLGLYAPQDSLVLLNSWQKEAASPQPGQLKSVPPLPPNDEKPLLLMALILALMLSIFHAYLPQKRYHVDNDLST